MSKELMDKIYGMIIDAYKKEDDAANHDCERMACYWNGKAEGLAVSLAELTGIPRSKINAEVVRRLNMSGRENKEGNKNGHVRTHFQELG